MIGIDLVKTSRINRSLERFGQKFLQKFLSSDEITLIKNHKTVSGFWAAKEACSKALGVGIGSECGFYDIKIYKTEKGAPKISLSQRVVENFKIKDISLSITHDGEYAIAVVAIESTASNKI
ncbi:holo-ACP synthase [Sulfurimonas sp.]|uniref:holo-ACP synthase n=1 Tax=Sulfurimonas sp. TaxID=2022749 RepID=UPI0025E3AD19|nr:holo-ACP synthase [Sulfurimonas sp.]MDD5156804.1 holo-ACP synthase [Sulfurimonas sp.]